MAPWKAMILGAGAHAIAIWRLGVARCSFFAAHPLVGIMFGRFRKAYDGWQVVGKPQIVSATCWP